MFSIRKSIAHRIDLHGLSRWAILLFALSSVACADVSAFRTAAAAQADRDVVVLLHGLGRNKTAMWRMEDRLESAGYQVQRVGYDSLTQSPKQIVQQVAQQIDACCTALPNRIHFVGHSLGGLVIRAYLQENPVETLGRVVLIGTPNQGSDFVDRYQDRWWLKMLGPTTQALGTGPDSLVKSLQVPDYPVGVIAGVQESANDAYLPGDDDGLVSVAATKIEGMKDFRLVEVGHSAMRYDDTVAQLTVAFLRNGAFPLESQ